ncbi:hypothetical protein KAFR_0L00120 [Kazachstania africana CBS 2517]|uniref:Secreted protein CSS2 C-terminal domain-containing protein n=1 Tax=Kazachstania africana (strain ATCC 22294 / BCRC 22015 / CBS 2517 / CECT 1963 / NBRC 1671 / NRRL Y-8276) TaxID=1071382 RepID=H2B1X0_KAZAF|nr:hypothetical protein KAFR_0L00120 [Kazachstania africana CBS 2517]CCF60620.1 hypothetical protein KAFR_0L00120 [Kazachstania africana CBS 2517]
MGGFYYKYYLVVGECSSTIEQKTVAGAIKYVISKYEGEYLCNIYSLSINHHGTWHATLVIGPTPKVWTVSLASTLYKGCYDEGCSGLVSPYSCSSSDDGK